VDPLFFGYIGRCMWQTDMVFVININNMYVTYVNQRTTKIAQVKIEYWDFYIILYIPDWYPYQAFCRKFLDHGNIVTYCLNIAIS
jgi:hypothetical protein